MLSGTENVYDVLSAVPTQTKPAFKVIVGVDNSEETKPLNDIIAFEEVLERGTYPIFLASETTFSLRVAESRKDSFTTIFELNAVI